MKVRKSSHVDGLRDAASWVVRHPFSLATQTLRQIISAKLQWQSGTFRTLGVTSCLPGEGKTIVAANLGHLIASTGKKVLLVDGGVHNRDLSKALAPDVDSGLVDVIGGRSTRVESVSVNYKTNLHFLPLGKPRSDALNNTWRNPMESLLKDACDTYDWVIIDLPPMDPLADVRDAASIIDAFLVVVEWGHTPAAIVEEALARSGVVKGKLLGTVLNRIDASKIRTYDRSAYLRGNGNHIDTEDV